MWVLGPPLEQLALAAEPSLSPLGVSYFLGCCYKGSFRNHLDKKLSIENMNSIPVRKRDLFPQIMEVDEAWLEDASSNTGRQ